MSSEEITSTNKNDKEARLRERRRQRLAQGSLSKQESSEPVEEKPEEKQQPEENKAEPSCEQAETSKADREAKLRDRRKQRLAQSASTREELITGIKRNPPSGGLQGTGSEFGANIHNMFNLDWLQNQSRPRFSAPQWVRKGSLMLILLAIIGAVWYVMKTPSNTFSVVLTTDSGGAWTTRRIAIIKALDQDRRLVRDDVVAAYTTKQHQRLVRSVVMDSIPTKASEPEQEEGEGEEGEREDNGFKEWRIVPIVARNCYDGEWLSEEMIKGRVIFSVSLFTLSMLLPFFLTYFKWAVRNN